MGWGRAEWLKANQSATGGMEAAVVENQLSIRLRVTGDAPWLATQVLVSVACAGLTATPAQTRASVKANSTLTLNIGLAAGSQVAALSKSAQVTVVCQAQVRVDASVWPLWSSLGKQVQLSFRVFANHGNLSTNVSEPTSMSPGSATSPTPTPGTSNHQEKSTKNRTSLEHAVAPLAAASALLLSASLAILLYMRRSRRFRVHQHGKT